LQRGQQPACVEACARQVLVFGERDQLLAEAHARLKARPDLYLSRVYGEKEVGGTSVLYIADVPLDFLGHQPLPELTEAAMSKVPAVALGVMGLMAGTYWIIERRMKLMNAHKILPPTPEQTDGGQT
jgi:formate dehydrogenase iron-sulfur subunit